MNLKTENRTLINKYEFIGNGTETNTLDFEGRRKPLFSGPSLVRFLEQDEECKYGEREVISYTLCMGSIWLSKEIDMKYRAVQILVELRVYNEPVLSSQQDEAWFTLSVWKKLLGNARI